MTLTNYGVPIGNVTIAAHIHHFVPGDELLFELFCNYAAELLGNSHFSFRRSQPIVVNTLIRLLDGDHLTRIAVESFWRIRIHMRFQRMKYRCRCIRIWVSHRCLS